MKVLKITTVGNSIGVILPKEILERLGVGNGDSLYVCAEQSGEESNGATEDLFQLYKRKG